MRDRPPVCLVVPGRLDTPTGGYIYDRRIIEGLRRRGWPVEVRELDDDFPFPSRASLDHAAGVLAGLPACTVVIVDGLAFGAMPDHVEREASRLRFVAIVHMPLADDVGLEAETAARLEASERRALAAAALVIVTGKATLRALERYGVAPDKIAVVEPGTDRAPAAPTARERAPLHLLCVATLNPGKGHDILLRALASMPHRNWRLTCAGSLTRHPATADRVRAMARALGLEDRVTFTGELDATQLAACYDDADLFVLATLRETYGMAVAEAVAHGLPVVSTTTGAIADLVGDEAGVLAPPGDVQAFGDALARVLGDPEFRARLAEGARRAADRLPSWDESCGRLSAVLQTLVESAGDRTYG